MQQELEDALRSFEKSQSESNIIHLTNAFLDYGCIDGSIRAAGEILRRCIYPRTQNFVSVDNPAGFEPIGQGVRQHSASNFGLTESGRISWPDEWSPRSGADTGPNNGYNYNFNQDVTTTGSDIFSIPQQTDTIASQEGAYLATSPAGGITTLDTVLQMLCPLLQYPPQEEALLVHFNPKEQQAACHQSRHNQPALVRPMEDVISQIVSESTSNVSFAHVPIIADNTLQQTLVRPCEGPTSMHDAIYLVLNDLVRAERYTVEDARGVCSILSVLFGASGRISCRAWLDENRAVLEHPSSVYNTSMLPGHDGATVKPRDLSKDQQVVWESLTSFSTLLFSERSVTERKILLLDQYRKNAHRFEEIKKVIEAESSASLDHTFRQARTDIQHLDIALPHVLPLEKSITEAIATYWRYQAGAAYKPNQALEDSIKHHVKAGNTVQLLRAWFGDGFLLAWRSSSTALLNSVCLDALQQALQTLQRFYPKLKEVFRETDSNVVKPILTEAYTPVRFVIQTVEESDIQKRPENYTLVKLLTTDDAKTTVPMQGGPPHHAEVQDTEPGQIVAPEDPIWLELD